MAIWDFRLNKRIMMITDTNVIKDEVVKAKFLSDKEIIFASQNIIGIFDVRKPSIILKECKL